MKIISYITIFHLTLLATVITAQDTTIVGPECGNTVCAYGQECCNPSCGTCVAPGTGCTQQICDQPCGSAYCLQGQQECCNEACSICTDIGSNQCPTSGGCVTRTPCGDGYCTSGQECCSPSCQQCVDIGAPCQPQVCETCGKKACPTGEICCNESCETCALPNAGCTLEICVPCGDKLCANGQYCCNESCGGICVPEGHTCNKDPCVQCGGVTCPQGIACVGGACATPALYSSTSNSAPALVANLGSAAHWCWLFALIAMASGFF